MRDVKVEKWLDKHGVKYTYRKSMDITSIDLKRSLLNQARLGDLEKKLDHDMVDRYALSILDGDDFPAIVVYKSGEGYVVISGNHRIHAHIAAEATSIEAYVISSIDDVMVQLLTRTANLLESGIKQPQQERLQHAVYFHEQLGMSLEDAASMCRVSRSTLSLYQRASCVRSIIGPRLSQAVPMSNASHMWKIRHDTDTVKALARLHVDHKLPSARFRTLCSNLSKRPKEDDKAALLDEFKQECHTIAANGRKSRSNMTTSDRLYGVLKSAKGMLEDAITSELQASKVFPEIQSVSKDVVVLLSKVAAL